MSTETDNKGLPVENVVVVKRGLDAKKEVFAYFCLSLNDEFRDAPPEGVTAGMLG